MVDVVIATGNRNKFSELKELLAMRGIRWHSLAEYPALRAARETGRTFEANAIRKARSVARATGLLAVADDSGLEVAALGWAPGVRSARFSGRHGDAAANNRTLLRRLAGVPAAHRRARYRCALALACPAGHRVRQGGADASRVIAVVHGTWAGRIAMSPVGRRGFGYDPLFVVPGHGKTVGQLPRRIKRRLSHRAAAARRLRPVLRSIAAHALVA